MVPTASEHGAAPERGDRIRLLLCLALLALILGILRVGLLDIPLERDEGAFAYMGRLILEGIPPYVQAYDYKPPGLYLSYALFIALFGGTPAGIHTGLTTMSIGTMLLLFHLVRRWSGLTGAFVAAFTALILLASPSVLGFAAHATQFVVFWGLLGYLLLEGSFDGNRPWKAVASGAAFACAALVKQPGAFFFLGGLILPFASRRARGETFGASLRTAGLLLSGFALPLAGVLLWLSAAGALGQFFYWNFEYPSMVAAGSGSTGILTRLFRNGLGAAGNFLPAWLAGIGSIAYVAARGDRGRARSGLLLLLLCSAAAVMVGYETRTHYFVMLIPALAASTGMAVSAISVRGGSGRVRLLAAGIACSLPLLGVVLEREYFFSADPSAISRETYFPNQFEDMGRVAEYVRSATGDTDRVAILGSEPEILFLSGRRSASRFIFTNFFHEKHGMREEMEREMIREIDSVRPAVIVVAHQPFSWGARPRPEWTILRWAAGYLREFYEVAGTVTPVAGGPSRFRWGKDAVDDTAAPANGALMIYRRAGEQP
jgi:hypothetical protein